MAKKNPTKKKTASATAAGMKKSIRKARGAADWRVPNKTARAGKKGVRGGTTATGGGPKIAKGALAAGAKGGSGLKMKKSIKKIKR